MSKFMTHVGALEAMRKGYKVAHLSFTSDEYLCIDDEGVIRCEMGYNFEKGFRDRENWEPEWFVREDSESKGWECKNCGHVNDSMAMSCFACHQDYH